MIMATIKKPICTLSIVSIFTLFLFSVTVQAGQPIDCLLCADWTMKTVVQTTDFIVMSTEGRGIIIDNSESKFFDNNTSHIVGTIKIDKGKMTGNYLAKYLDPSGDFYVLELSQIGNEFDYKFIYGTGKFKGISGSGKSYRITKGSPVSPGTAQGCSKITGTYELNK
jgi:hypothetical protein